jgi:hypothetical protein
MPYERQVTAKKSINGSKVAAQTQLISENLGSGNFGNSLIRRIAELPKVAIYTK